MNIQAVGNLTEDPQLNITPSGQPLSKFTIACNRRYQQNGEWQTQTNYFDCVVWGDQAENAAQSLKKGDRVIVIGRVEIRRWQTNDGGYRSRTEIVVEEIGPSLRWATAEVLRIKRES